MLQIITDSSCDLPKELLRQYHIRVVPLTVAIDGREYTDGVDITPQEFYQKMFGASSLPKTSQPAPAVFAKTFEEMAGNGPLLCLTISSKLSGTYQSACVAKDLANVPVTIFDTWAGSLGVGLQVIRAAELAARGLGVEEIVERLTAYRGEMNILILLDTLENIVKGGRLSKFQGTVAQVLGIKVLLEGVEGSVELREKIRGRTRFLQRAIDIIGERRTDYNTTFGITHVDNLADAEYLKELIVERYHPQRVIINDMGSTMGTYAGKGGIIVSF
jgi:fatty acid kinase fatty acid binding subunit